MEELPGLVTIFTTTTCPHCKAAKALLSSKHVKMVSWELDLYPPEAREYVSVLAGGAKSVPQIFLNDVFLPGGNSNLQDLEKQGKLDDVLTQGLSLPPGPHVPRISFEKKALQATVVGLGFAGLEPNTEAESALRACYLSMHSVFKGRSISTLEAKEWFRNQSLDVNLLQQLQDCGVLVNVSSSSTWMFSSDRKPTCLNLTFDNSHRKTSAVSKRSASELASAIRAEIAKLHQTFLSPNGLGVNYKKMKESKEFQLYSDLTCELQLVELAGMKESERKAFFINLYNALAIHGFALLGHPDSGLGRSRFFNTTSYRIGATLEYSLNDLEHGSLRGNRPSPAGLVPFFRGTLFSSLPFFAPSGDERLKYIVPLDPRIHFALNCGAKSCPPIKLFSSEHLDEELTLAAQAFCEDDSNVKIENKVVFLTMILKWYGSDFGATDAEKLKRVSDFLVGDKQVKMKALVASNDFIIKYNVYDWSANSAE